MAEAGNLRRRCFCRRTRHVHNPTSIRADKWSCGTSHDRDMARGSEQRGTSCMTDAGNSQRWLFCRPARRVHSPTSRRADLRTCGPAPDRDMARGSQQCGTSCTVDAGNLQRQCFCRRARHVHNPTSRQADMATCVVVANGCRARLAI
jgi:hypothetical protein